MVNHILAMAQACRVSHTGFQRDQNALQAPDFPGQGAGLGVGLRAYSSRMRAADMGVGGGRSSRVMMGISNYCVNIQ